MRNWREGGWGHATTIQGKNHDERCFCPAKKRLLPANSSSPSRRVPFPLEIRPRPASLRRSFMGRILVKNRFHGGKNDTAGGGGEGHPETLGVAVNGTVSNGIFRIGRSGWRADIFRSRTPSERRGRRGLCARPPIKKIKSPRYFL